MDAPGRDEAVPARRRMGIGAAVVLVLLALAVTVAIGLVRSATGAAETVVIEPTAAPAVTSPADASEVYVHVSGAVRTPGLYRLPARSRLVDAVAAAGGFADDAQRDGVNLARTVADGEQVHVPAVGEQPAAAPSEVAESEPGLVDLNTAGQVELETLPRIGPAIAQRIVEWRDANGAFTSVEDLLAVPGIGDRMLEALRPLVTV